MPKVYLYVCSIARLFIKAKICAGIIQSLLVSASQEANCCWDGLHGSLCFGRFYTKSEPHTSPKEKSVINTENVNLYCCTCCYLNYGDGSFIWPRMKL